MREYFANIRHAIESILTGLTVTLRNMGKRTVTRQYPDAMTPVAPRYRGFHEYQVERCIACGACARACPVDCILIEADGKGKTAIVKRYAIDYARCMFCGLCVSPCPTRCLHMGKLHDMSGYARNVMIVEFTELASLGRRTPEPPWLARGRREDKITPLWLRVLAEQYASGPAISWGPAGDIDVKSKPKERLTWADRT